MSNGTGTILSTRGGKEMAMNTCTRCTLLSDGTARNTSAHTTDQIQPFVRVFNAVTTVNDVAGAFGRQRQRLHVTRREDIVHLHVL